MKRIYGSLVLYVFFANIIYSQNFNTPDTIKPGLTIKEITITSLRFSKKLDEITLPLEIVTPEKLRTSPGVTISDVLKNEAGISISRDGIWATTVTIRGLGKSSIVTLIDGNRIETATDLAAGLSLINTDDIESVELIKGSSSVLYGTGAVGGVINIFTKQSHYSESTFLKGSLFSGYNNVNKQASGGLLFNAGASNWHAKIYTNLRSAENTKTPQGEIPNSQFRDRSFSSTVAFKPQLNQEIKFNYQNYTATDAGIPGGSTLFPANALVRYADINREMFDAEYKLNNMFSLFNIFSVKYYFQNISRYVENIPFQKQTVAAQNGQPAKIVNVLSITPNARHYTQGVQLQSDWALASNNYLIAGLDIWKRNLDSKREKNQRIDVLNSANTVVNSIFKTIGERPIPESDFRNIGAFINDEAKYLDNKLILNFGARFDAIKVTNQKTFNPGYEITSGVINITPAGQALNWDAREVNDYSWSGNAGVLYSLTNSLDLTLNLARSFRSPSLEERYQYIDLGNVLRIGDPDLKPEDGYFTDLGFRFWKEDFNVRANVFANFIKNMIVEIPGVYQTRNALIKTNSGNARLFGFDLSTEYYINDDYSVYATASYVKGSDTQNNTELPQIPPLNGHIGVNAAFDGLCKVDLSAVLFAAQEKVASGEITTPGYAMFNLSLISYPVDFNFSKLFITAGIENILDKSYRNHLSTNRGLVSVEPGRNIFVKLQIEW